MTTEDTLHDREMPEELARLGFTERLAAAFAPMAAEGLVPGRVALEHRSRYVVYTAAGERPAVLRGRLRHAAASGGELPVVGDWVALTAAEGDAPATIDAVLPRASAFVRRAAGRATQAQVVAANVDVVLLVTAVGRDLNPRRLERYLALARESGAEPVIVVSKSDLTGDLAAALSEIGAVALDAPVLGVSSVTGAGIDELRRYLRAGRTAALLGSSGVGKSTLVNALLGHERQHTAAVGDDGKGRHTTTHRELLPAPGGAWLLDTPGMRELQLWTGEEGLTGAFEDVATLAARCRFADCHHHTEPGCAVRAAVDEGALPADRLESWHKLEAEQRFVLGQHDERQKADAKREARILGRAARTRIREKYGGSRE
jgi:ribosome biogenesis GTPase / thiamine phosphate phosphatase